MNCVKYFALVCAGSATLMSSAIGAAQSAASPAAPRPVPQAVQPAQVAQPAPAASAPAAPDQVPVYPPPPARTVPVYAAPAPAPASSRPYAVYDPSTGQTLLMTPLIQRTPPRELPYSENRPVPRGYVVEEYHPRGLIISGAVTLGVLWGMSFVAASDENFSGENGWLAVPVVGPFGWLAARKTPRCNSDYYYSDCNNDESSKRTLVAIDGMGQLAGAALLVAGLAITRKHLVLADPQAAFAVVPYASSRGSGLQLVGRF